VTGWGTVMGREEDEAVTRLRLPMMRQRLEGRAVRRRWPNGGRRLGLRPEEDDDLLRAGTRLKRSSGLEARWAASAGWDKLS
jgi:hypothetical protein